MFYLQILTLLINRLGVIPLMFINSVHSYHYIWFERACGVLVCAIDNTTFILNISANTCFRLIEAWIIFTYCILFCLDYDLRRTVNLVQYIIYWYKISLNIAVVYNITLYLTFPSVKISGQSRVKNNCII